MELLLLVAMGVLELRLLSLEHLLHMLAVVAAVQITTGLLGPYRRLRWWR
jgi:hypothetical protein